MTNAVEQLYERLLVLRSQTKDEAAFAELMERYQPRLRYYLRKLLRDVHLTEDLLQETWLDVFRAVGRLRDVSAFRSWLYCIARGHAMRVLRKQRLPVQPLTDDTVVDPETEAMNFTEDDVEFIHRGLDQLVAEQREVLVLRYIEAMTYDEIAGIVGCQVGTVRSRLHYAKQALQGILERMKFNE